MQVKKQQLEPCMEQLIVQDQERSTTGLSAVTLFNLYAEHIMRNAGWVSCWVSYTLESRQVEETSATSDMQMIPP